MENGTKNIVSFNIVTTAVIYIIAAVLLFIINPVLCYIFTGISCLHLLFFYVIGNKLKQLYEKFSKKPA